MADPVLIEKMRSAPMVEIPVLNKFKRKRTNSTDHMTQPRAHQEKKARPANVAIPVQLPAASQTETKFEREPTFTKAPAALPPSRTIDQQISTSASPGLVPPTTSLAPLDRGQSGNAPQKLEMKVESHASLDAQPSVASGNLTRLQEVIENEFSMQILLKHNELRLIEQELAKCQVALEQLRRVELRPYPGSQNMSESVTSGTGHAVDTPFGYSKPTHPAPYGVTDGPYSSHYRQWLLHDPLFDSASMQSQMYTDSSAQSAARSTRNSGSVRKSVSKSFTFPAHSYDSLPSIPNYPAPAPKDKSAPLVLKRSTDGQLVKLICNDCLRGDFSSIQGFLNHCRIAHKVDYKSHDAAAVDCGRVLEEHEAANLPPQVHHTPSHKPKLSGISTAASNPYKNVVHPLNTAAGASNPLSKNQTVPVARKAVPSLAKRSSASIDASLQPSTQVPRLSAHFAKYNVGGDLVAAVAGAQQKVDLGPEDDSISTDVSEQNSPLAVIPGSRTVGSQGRASKMTMSGARSASQKGITHNQRQPKPFPLKPSGAMMKQETDSEILESPEYSTDAAIYSPHTADSNPGLVSDDEEDEDDHGSASEEEAPQDDLPRPFGVSARTCSENVEIDVAEDDDHVDSGLIIRRNGLFADEERSIRGAGSPSRKLGLGKRER